MRLPEELRPTLQKPMGKLFKNTEKFIEFFNKKKPAMLVTIGDVVTANVLGSGIKPDLAVVDFIAMRSETSDDLRGRISKFNVREVKVKNPAGTITPGLWETFEKIKLPAKIIVDGEEDLATLPAVLLLPLGTVVVYGQPNEGLVVIEITAEKRREFSDILKRFEKI